MIDEKHQAGPKTGALSRIFSPNRRLVNILLSLVILTYCFISWRSIPLLGDQRPFSYPPDHVLSSYMQITRDPLGEPLGYPTLSPNASHLHIGEKAMISCDVPICSQMGGDILRKGGNAADAAVTVALCIGSINSHSSGIGGGGYITSSFENDVISIDAREMAPQSAFKEMYREREILSKFGGLAVAVPGELKGLYELYQRHGSKNVSWYELFEPVIELNRKGFRTGRVVAKALKSLETYVPILKLTSIFNTWDFIFKDKDNYEFVQEDDIIKRESLANTLELIAKSGSSDIFYDPKGPIVESLVQVINGLGGWIDREDFANYQVSVEKALKFDFNSSQEESFSLFTSSGSSSGLALITALNFFSTLHNKSPTSDVPLKIHRTIESMKWMASARSNFGDFLVHKDSSSNKTFRQDLIDKYSSLNWSQSTIESKYSDNRTFPWQHYEPKYELTEPHGTSHFSIVDKSGNAVGMTTTVNLLFGSLVYDNRTGIILNNEMDDFSVPNSPNAFNLTPSIYNFIEPKKRPLSSTSPTIVMTKQGTQLVPSLVIGAAGGSRITTAIFQALVNIYYDNIPLLKAISYPRLHHQLIPEYAMCENYEVFQDRYQDINMIRELRDRFGHDFQETGPLTVMNGVKGHEDNKGKLILEGVADYWRKLGEAWGY
ncbi:glutathione hydrolase proenzyme [[Candida] railenensis]|uniref:Glutathione hydrolase n=1 Tax=[Candida] railenensis TaxID=45579 RepID=A0A9P0QLX6_9ASCO|nr:glutathione hydrolase proenzyme [[Candida] railenensis]